MDHSTFLDLLAFMVAATPFVEALAHLVWAFRHRG